MGFREKPNGIFGSGNFGSGLDLVLTAALAAIHGGRTSWYERRALRSDSGSTGRRGGSGTRDPNYTLPAGQEVKTDSIVAARGHANRWRRGRRPDRVVAQHYGEWPREG